jgi:hypothetical protein
LILNIAVLVPIVVLMALKTKIVDDTWGPFTAARGILWSIFCAILVVAIALLDSALRRWPSREFGQIMC